MPPGLLLAYAFRRLALGWRANGPIRLLLGGACIGCIPPPTLSSPPTVAAHRVLSGDRWAAHLSAPYLDCTRRCNGGDSLRRGSQKPGVRNQESGVRSRKVTC